MTEKKAYTPIEFAALFGREKTWTYRMLYAGKIHGISEYGRMMIPSSEAERVASDAGRYLGKKKAAKKAAKELPQDIEKGSASKANGQWKKWVETRSRSPRQQETGRRAFRLPKSLKKGKEP